MGNVGGKRSMHVSCINFSIVNVALVHGCLKVRTQYHASCLYQHHRLYNSMVSCGLIRESHNPVMSVVKSEVGTIIICGYLPEDARGYVSVLSPGVLSSDG